MSKQIRVQMLGRFSLQVGDIVVSDEDNRSHKVWLLLAYLIHNRKKNIRQEELYELLWGEDFQKENPQNALRAILHRVRSILDQLENQLGHKMIIRRQGNYAWNTLADFTVDTDAFQQLCEEAAAHPEQLRLPLLSKAIDLYRGNFLQNFPAESWMAAAADRYHTLYISAVQEALKLSAAEGNSEAGAALCRKALQIDPCSEELCTRLLQDLLQLKRYREAVSTYEEMSKRFFDALGTLPPEACQNLYHEALCAVNGESAAAEVPQEEPQGPPGEEGPMVCDFAVFQSLYRSTACLTEGSGKKVHIAKISIADPKGEPMGKRKLAHAMDLIEAEICRYLRDGDVLSRYDASRFAILLPMTGYEESCLICEQAKKSYAAKYPHSLARLTCAVQSLDGGEAALALW